ncbi:MAG: hypothetical protein ACRD03_04545 [Acidimicrobiales bacterium]
MITHIATVAVYVDDQDEAVPVLDRGGFEVTAERGMDPRPAGSRWHRPRRASAPVARTTAANGPRPCKFSSLAAIVQTTFGNPVDMSRREAQSRCPMARIRIAERTLQGRSLSSFGALGCTPGQYLDHEDQPGRRELANAGRPVVRW